MQKDEQIVLFTAKCPVCGGEMADNSRLCSLKCLRAYDEGKKWI